MVFMYNANETVGAPPGPTVVESARGWRRLRAGTAGSLVLPLRLRLVLRLVLRLLLLVLVVPRVLGRRPQGFSRIPPSPRASSSEVIFTLASRLPSARVNSYIHMYFYVHKIHLVCMQGATLCLLPERAREREEEGGRERTRRKWNDCDGIFGFRTGRPTPEQELVLYVHNRYIALFRCGLFSADGGKAAR